jgi:hypothetical protein
MEYIPIPEHGAALLNPAQAVTSINQRSPTLKIAKCSCTHDTRKQEKLQ